MKKLLTAVDVAEKFNVTVPTVYRWGADPSMGFPQPFPVGGASRWDADDLDRFIEKQKEIHRGNNNG